MLTNEPSNTIPCDPPDFDPDDDAITSVWTTRPCTPPPPSSNGPQDQEVTAAHALSDLFIADTRSHSDLTGLFSLLNDQGVGTDDPVDFFSETPTLVGLTPAP